MALGAKRFPTPGIDPHDSRPPMCRAPVHRPPVASRGLRCVPSSCASEGVTGSGGVIWRRGLHGYSQILAPVVLPVSAPGAAMATELYYLAALEATSPKLRALEGIPESMRFLQGEEFSLLPHWPGLCSASHPVSLPRGVSGLHLITWLH